MELRELRSFTTAAKLKSITRAAEHLGIGQPTVTTHIRKLETELTTVLFDRVKAADPAHADGDCVSAHSHPAGGGDRRSISECVVGRRGGPGVIGLDPRHHFSCGAQGG